MITESQKRRNYSKNLPTENRLCFNRQNGSSLLVNLGHPSALKAKPLNKSLISLETEENPIKKRSSLTPFRNNQQPAYLDHRFSALSGKVKNLVKNDEYEEDKENVGIYKTIKTDKFDKTRSSLLKKSQLNLRSFLGKEMTSAPYFVQCLKRKGSVLTQVCMHIHSSIYTFLQYMHQVQLVNSRGVDPRIPAEIKGRKTVVFDMDETLIHTNEVMMKGYEIKVPFRTLNGKVINGYVNVRPYAKEIIRNVSRYFDVIVFTAGNQCYADPILNYLDPEGRIQHRLYRDSCTIVGNQVFVKDLRILGRKLENVVLVDNAPYSYMMQMANGIPILSYLRGKEDDQLVRLQEYLMSLLEVEDVRMVNTSIFKLSEYHKFNSYDKLVQELYGKWL